MAENQFIQNPVLIQQTIDRILKSPNYSDEYKEHIRGLIADHKKFKVNELGVSVQSATDGTIGFIEKPNYVESELIKSIDTNITELIKPQEEEKPEVVLKTVHEDLRKVYDETVVKLTDTKRKLDEKISEIVGLESKIKSLEQEIDTAEVLRETADNTSEQITDKYTKLLTDFQSVMQKGIEEAIHRVSLEAQVKGLTAQVDVLSQQIKSLNSELTGAAAEQSATAQDLKQTEGGKRIFYKVEGAPKDKWTTSRDHPASTNGVGKFIIQNLDKDLTITKVVASISGDLHGEGPYGFGTGTRPSLIKAVSIEPGGKLTIPINAGTTIGGAGRHRPRPHGWNWLHRRGDRAKDYSGKMSFTVYFSDGSSDKTQEYSWKIRKNRG